LTRFLALLESDTANPPLGSVGRSSGQGLMAASGAGASILMSSLLILTLTFHEC
jgi:hypothetical protein